MVAREVSVEEVGSLTARERPDVALVGLGEPAAFELLREHAHSTNRKLVDVASAVVDGHRLLPKQPHSPASTAGPGG
jgi:ANTAR domain